MKARSIVDPKITRDTDAGRSLVDVAVGILLRPTDGAFLLTSRPANKPYAGYWEFPGGKLESGETVLEALGRELKEEIGIQLREATIWRELVFDYPHALVRLHFCKTACWSGEIEMLEGQEFKWAQLPITVTPVLPGTIPVLAWLAEERAFVGKTHFL